MVNSVDLNDKSFTHTIFLYNHLENDPRKLGTRNTYSDSRVYWGVCRSWLNFTVVTYNRNILDGSMDALICLQLFTEHILVMVFEMTYSFIVNLLILKNKIAIHVKRQTIMDHDMQLLRDLWGTIAPESALGKDDTGTSSPLSPHISDIPDIPESEGRSES